VSKLTRVRPTKWGTQPARAVVRARDITYDEIAAKAEVPYTHVLNSLLGITAPSPRLRRELSAMLDLPVEELFTEGARTARFRNRPDREWDPA
jgi:hypothetical protein